MNIKPENSERAERGAAALAKYRDLNPDYSGRNADEPDAQALADLLADLRHHCQRDNIDFQAAFRMSEIHYQEEK